MNITRLDADHYLVGSVVITRQYDKDGQQDRWAAVPRGDVNERPLFTLNALDDALDMAAGAIAMLAPVDPPRCTGTDPYGGDCKASWGHEGTCWS